jgi:Concanavalin A-like lectin/glucanases superfamily/Secretion system C-terminal sorting domain
MKARFVLQTLVIILITISNNLYSQSLQWANATGSSGTDFGFSNTVDATGNIIKCGTFSGTSVDFDPGAGTTLLSSNGAVDFFVAKNNAAGQLIWAFNIGGTDRDESFSVATDAAGNIYVTGYFRGSNVDFDPGPGTAFLSSNGDIGTDVGYGGDIFIAKYSPTGQYLWAKNIGGTSLYDSGIALDVDPAGNVYFSGYFQLSVDFDADAGTAILNSGSGTAFLCKYNSAGAYQWAFNYGLGNADNSPQFVKYDPAGYVYMTGFYQGANIDFDPSAGSGLLSAVGGYEVYVAKYNLQGQYQWARSAGGLGDDVARALTLDNAGNVYVTGDFRGLSCDFDPLSAAGTVSNNGGADIFLIKYNSAGQYQFAYGMGGPQDDLGLGIDTDNNSLFVTGSFSGSNVDFDPSGNTYLLSSSGGTDMFYTSYSLGGQFKCGFKVGGSLNDYCRSLITTGTNTINSVGYFQSTGVDFDPGAGITTLSSNGNFDIFQASYQWNIAVVANNDTTICTGGAVQMNASGATSYSWSPATGLSNPNIANPLATPTVTTRYIVTGSNGAGCTTTDTVTVTVNNNCEIPCNSWLSTPAQGAYVSIGDLDVSGNQLTVEASFNRTAPLNNGLFYGHLVSKHTGAFDMNYALLPNGCEIGTTNGYFSTFQNCLPELNKTYHVAMVYDGATLKFYRNGFLQSQTPCTGNMLNNNLQTVIAQIAGGGFPFNNQFLGYVNEVRIWNVARTQAQLAANMNSILPSPTTTTGLLGYYRFDNLLNKQGNAAYNGTLNGAASIGQTNPNCVFVPDSCNVACNAWLSTPTQGAYVTVGDLDVSGNQLTVEANVNRTQPLNSGIYYGHLIAKHTNETNINYVIFPNGCAITTTNGYYSTFQNCLPDLNKTYHVAMVYDGTMLKFYRNGFLQSQTPCTGNMINNNLPTTIAQISSSGAPLNNQFLGYVNEVRIWNVARTQSQLRTYMNSTLPGPTTQTGLLGYYTFDNLLNKQGNAAYNGTLNGSAAINQTNPNCTFLNDSCGVVIPVQLTSFTAQVVDNKKVELAWQTEEESDLQAYILERSLNANNGFAPIATVQPRNISGSRYSYTDADVKPGVLYYYRLRIKELTGQVKFSAIRIAKITGQGIAALVYPNPSDHHLYVQLTGYQGNATVTVVDNLGRRMLQRVFANNNGLLLLDVSKLANGSYHLLIETEKDKIVRPWVKR